MHRKPVLVEEQLEILRRIADRGLSLSQEQWAWSQIDLWQHMLNEIMLTKKALNDYQT